MSYKFNRYGESKITDRINGNKLLIVAFPFVNLLMLAILFVNFKLALVVLFYLIFFIWSYYSLLKGQLTEIRVLKRTIIEVEILKDYIGIHVPKVFSTKTIFIKIETKNIITTPANDVKKYFFVSEYLTVKEFNGKEFFLVKDFFDDYTVIKEKIELIKK